MKFELSKSSVIENLETELSIKNLFVNEEGLICRRKNVLVGAPSHKIKIGADTEYQKDSKGNLYAVTVEVLSEISQDPERAELIKAFSIVKSWIMEKM